jgi:hypothetical protein
LGAAAFSVAILHLAATAAVAAPTGPTTTYQYYPTTDDPGFTFNFFPATLVVTDAAVASGSLNLSLFGICHNGAGGLCGGYTGNLGGFVSLTMGPQGPAQEVTTSTDWAGLQVIDISFNPDGTLGGNISGGGFTSDLRTFGGEFNWFGSWGSDALACPDQNVPTNNYGCLNPGYWYTAQTLPVREPGSIWLFGGGFIVLLLLGVFRSDFSEVSVRGQSRGSMSA